MITSRKIRSEPTPISAEQLRRDLAVRDLTDPSSGPHAIQYVVDNAVACLASAWGCQVRWCRGARVVPVVDNYDRLGFDTNAVTRDVRYTRYVDAERMLRSHSTALIPEALDHLAAEPADDVLLVCPAVVYRRDVIDWQHSGCPHQLDLWRITRCTMQPADLDEMVRLLLEALLPGKGWQAEPRTHPYTLDGRQIDVRNGDRWVEVWECGLARPDVLSAAGLTGWHGLACGLGLDRLLMLIKGIPDIRLLRSDDPRVADQMLNLSPYRPVSSHPAVRRDISVAVDEDDDADTLGDRVREALGADATIVEEVAVLGETAYNRLPPAARDRLGAREGQKNVLLRLTLRDHSRTLTDAEANATRDRIYAAVHQGTAYQWAAAAPTAQTESHRTSPCSGRLGR